VFRFGFRIPLGPASLHDQACDNSGYKEIEGKRKLAKTIGIVGAIVAAGGDYGNSVP
jgi:hypothetical protein